jgi:hypothetical protein
MEDGRWKMEDGRWKMEDGRWKIEDGREAAIESLPAQRFTDDGWSRLSKPP